MKFIRRLLFCRLLLTLLLAGAYLFAPWKGFLETRIIAVLYDAGIENVAFKIQDVNFHEVTLSDISLGKENPLVLKAVNLEYSPREIASGNLQNITLTGLNLRAVESETGWRFTGMDILPKRGDGETAAGIDVPAVLESLPFASIKIEDSTLQIEGKSLRGVIPFSLSLDQDLSISTKATQFTAGPMAFDLGEFVMNAAPDEKKHAWNGSWSLAASSAGDDSPVPPMSGAGSLQLLGASVKAAGAFASADKAYKLSIDMIADISDPDKNQARLVSASLPFKKGTVSTANVILKMPMTVPLTIKKVSMDDLLQSLTGEKVSATGTVSGAVPLLLAKDGSYSFGKGELKSDSSGQITMPPDLIPGDNEQVALVRQIMENLQYSILSAGVKSGKDGKMTVALRLEGNNPDVYSGRKVKLNINLTGDVLDIVQQNIMLFTRPEKLLEQKYHE